MTESSARYQYFAAFVVNILAIGYGFNCGWGSPNLFLLMSDESPLPSGKITIEEASWIAAFICVGGMIGNLFFGFLTEKFGRKKPLLVSAIPLIISWLLMLFAQNVYYLYVARAINGFIGSGVFIIIPLYLSEIASDKVRGILGSTFMFTYNIGVLLAFIIGNYFTYDITPKIVIALLTLFFCVFYIFPDSPNSLVKRNQIDEAEKSLKYYRNLSDGEKESEFLLTEMNRLKAAIGTQVTEKQSTDNALKLSDFTTKEFRKSMTIGFVLVALNQFSGCFAMLNYTATIFKESGSSMSPNMSAIVVGVIQLIGTCVSVNLVDLAGRKFLMTLSCVGAALGLICFGTHALMKTNGYDVESLNWIPVTSMSFVIFIASWGILTLPYLIISEIMPEKVKNFSTSFCMELSWFFTFLMLKYLPTLTEVLGMHGSMFLFAGVCLVSALFIVLVMPETKGKSYEQIMESLR